MQQSCGRGIKKEEEKIKERKWDREVAKGARREVAESERKISRRGS